VRQQTTKQCSLSRTLSSVRAADAEENLDFINKVPDLRAVKGLHNLWNP